MAKQIYQIHISLQDIKPKIWRRILVSSNTTLVDFHEIIQTVMGWTNSHLHKFEKGQDSYSPKEFELEETKDSRKVKLNLLLKKENDNIVYEYDLGDSWLHDILLEKIWPFTEEEQIPICLEGKGNCPPEDCGGFGGYFNLLKIISNPKHKEYEETLDWLGGGFDPDEFDLEGINELLQEEDFGCIWF